MKTLLVVLLAASPALAQFEEIPLPVMPGNSSFEDIIGYRALSIPPDGSVWVTGSAGQMRIDGSTAPLVEPTYGWGANDAVVGDDGAIWIAHDLGLRRRNPSTLELTQINSMFLTEIEREPGGALWLVQYVPGSGAVHRYIPSSGAMVSFPLERLPNTSLFLGDALWVLITDETGPSHKVVRITPAGAMTQFSVPEAGAFVPATDGRIWVMGMTTFTRITPSTGEVATYPSPIPQTRYPNFSAKGVSFAVAPDGAIWIAHMGGLARLQDEWITNYASPELPPGGFFRPSYRPGAAFGPDGRLAFIDRYVICCRILPTIPGPPVPGGVVRRVNVAALTGGQTAHIGNADVPFASPLVLAVLAIALSAVGLRHMKSLGIALFVAFTTAAVTVPAVAQTGFRRITIPRAIEHRAIGLSFTADGAAWVTGEDGRQVRIAPNGSMAQVPPSLPASTYREAVTGPDGAIWVVGNAGLLRRDPTTYAISTVMTTSLSFIETGTDGYLWAVERSIGTTPTTHTTTIHRVTPGGAVTSFPLIGSGAINDAVYTAGALWVNRVDTLTRIASNGAMTTYGVPLGSLLRMPGGRVGSSSFGRIHRFDPATARTETFNVHLELPLTSVEDSAGNVWVPHFAQLSRFTENQIVRYRTPVLPNLDCEGIPSRRPAAAFAPNGELWIIDRWFNLAAQVPGGPPCTTIGDDTILIADPAAIVAESEATLIAEIPSLSNASLILLGFLVAGTALFALRR